MKTKTKKQIGAEIKKRRVALGLSRYALMNESKVQLAQLKSIEDASSNYTVECLLKVENALTKLEKEKS